MNTLHPTHRPRRQPCRRLTLAAALAATALAAGCVVAPPYGYYSDAVVAPEAPPAAPVRGEPVGTPPATGQVWIDGYWDWGGASYVWVPGYWTVPRVGFYWVPRTWMLSGRVWIRHGGHWRRR